MDVQTVSKSKTKSFSENFNVAVVLIRTENELPVPVKYYSNVVLSGLNRWSLSRCI